MQNRRHFYIAATSDIGAKWPAPKIKTNSEQTGYRKRGRKPVRRTDFMNDPTVIARRKQALARLAAAE
ncbi:hypothetical protein [Mesorhizobium sp. IMUNJ 23232]|uniref:hypothetical protein n=1 Tax=Mesorhizobium sp. IMUNJ 23232 TaxID=3376064 RepID=UPI0037BC5B3D